jgi:uncharacterized protein YndB with AHSA1/START domain
MAADLPADLPADAGVVDLTFRRVLAAPRAAVWAAWTEAARFARWFGPHGTALDPCEVDACVGGRLFFCHRHATIEPVWVLGRFLVVDPMHRLVLIVGFAGPDGAPRPRDGFNDSGRIEVRLDDEGAGTVMTVRHTGLASDQGESEGWRQSFERLEALLAGR